MGRDFKSLALPLKNFRTSQEHPVLIFWIQLSRQLRRYPDGDARDPVLSQFIQTTYGIN